MSKVILYISSIVILIISAPGCKVEPKEDKNPQENLPTELQNKVIGLDVEHSKDTVFATINIKDPEKRGKYQLQFTTSVKSMNGDIQITEFGSFILYDGEWKMRTIFDRPFNGQEFEKWYDCPSALIESGKEYSDSDNWLSKGNKLDGRILNAILYFKGLISDNQEVYGYRKIIGVLDFEKNIETKMTIPPNMTIDSAISIIDKTKLIQDTYQQLRKIKDSVKLLYLEVGLTKFNNKTYQQVNFSEDNGDALVTVLIYYVNEETNEIFRYIPKDDIIVEI